MSEELIAESPMKKVSMPKLDKRILPAFTEAEVKQLLAACSGNGGAVDLKDGTAHIRQGKGRKDRVVYLGSRTRRAMLRYYLDRSGAPGAAEPVWTNERSGERLTDSGLRQLLERLGKRADVEHRHSHTFRRTFAL